MLKKEVGTIYCVPQEYIMLCPFCLNPETKVIDKREIRGVTRRRRECLKCERRFNTFEMLEEIDLKVLKKDGRREEFDREKIRRGIIRACEKRPVSTEQIDSVIAFVEDKARSKGKEITSETIGQMVSKELKKVDKVAYIRFASVYKDFTEIDDFKKEIREILKK